MANDRISKRKPEKKKKKKKEEEEEEKDNRVVSFSRAPVRALGYAALCLALLVRPDAGVEIPAGQPKQPKQAM